MRTIVHNIEEALTEILRQLEAPDFFMHNYRLLDGCQDYLEESEASCKEHGVEFDKEEQLFNYLTYELGWEDEREIFPMKL